MIPKTGSFNYCSQDLFVCVYAIMAELEVNWTKIMLKTIIKHHTSFLSYRACLIHIFKKYKFDLQHESNMIRNFELFDHSMLLRMKIPSIKSQTQAAPSSPYKTTTHHEPQKPPISQLQSHPLLMYLQLNTNMLTTTSSLLKL